jgi:hypothetical protein
MERHDLLYLVCHGLGASPELTRVLANSPIQLLLIHLVPHMLDVELLLSLPEIVELLLAASRCGDVSF